jgi:hypothetical protein
MSEWYKPKADDIELSDDGKTLEISICANNSGNLYAEIPLSMLAQYFKDDAEIKALRAELDAAWGVRGDTNITDEYKRGFMAALYTVHTAMLAARKDGSS